MTREELFVEVWRQALVDGAQRVKIGEGWFRVNTTTKMKLHQVDFQFEGEDFSVRLAVYQSGLSSESLAKGCHPN